MAEYYERRTFMTAINEDEVEMSLEKSKDQIIKSRTEEQSTFDKRKLVIFITP